MDIMIIKILLIGISEEAANSLQDIKEEGLLNIELKSILKDSQIAEACIANWEPNLVILKISDEFSVWEFMDEIHRRENKTEVLLLSHEKNFEYAYQALRHHAINFLLEPVTKEVWAQNIEEVIAKIKQVDELQKDRQKLDLYELKKHQELMERMISNMLEKPEELEMLLSEVNNRYQTDLCNDNFQAIVINADKQELYYEKTGFLGKILRILENSFPWAHEVVSAMVMPYGITGIINFSYDRFRDYKERYITDLYKNITELKKEYGEFAIAIGVGNIVHSMKEVNQSLGEAFRAEQYKLVTPGQNIFYASHISQNLSNKDILLTNPQKKNLSRFLKNMVLADMVMWFDEIFLWAEDNFKEYPEGYGQLKDQIILLVKEAWKDKITEDYLQEEEYTLRQMNHVFQGRKMLEFLKEVIYSIGIKRKEVQNIKLSEPIQEALTYINQHFAEAVTLEQLADVCGLSANYFSYMFKEQVGETYIEYLTEVRLMQAKQLLLNTKKTVKEIVGEIGYNDDKYFRKLFKNRFGDTPSAYRKNSRTNP